MRNYPNLAAEKAAARQDRKEHNNPVLARGPLLAQAFANCRWHMVTARKFVQRVDASLRRTRRLES